MTTFEDVLESSIGNGETKGIIGFIDTSFSSSSLGEEFIMNDCRRIVDGLYPSFFKVGHASHCRINTYAKYKLNQCKHIFVGGTNLLCYDIDKFNQWQYYGLEELNSKPILMGCGWHSYSDYITDKSAEMLRKVLNSDYLHAIRDQYTVDRLKSIGIDNVINTSCPTLWGIKGQYTGKRSSTCVLVFHYGFQDFNRDYALLQSARKKYNKVLIWPQGYLDVDYALTLGASRSEFLHPSTSAFDSAMNNFEADYIGTRLHAGARAMQLGLSSNVIAVDNRAKEMLGDVGLKYYDPTVDGVDEIFSSIDSYYTTTLPRENIEKWLSQFKN